MAVPPRPKIFHITHVDNLPRILASGGLFADAVLSAEPMNVTGIGMSNIKRRRLQLPVRCHPGDVVGNCVPFYFCPRSIMLYILHCRNHPDLAYRGGQEPIIHLELDLFDVVNWADKTDHRWSFTLSNAGARYAEFRSTLNQLDELDWEAIASTDFRSAAVKERKQAEFLVHGFVSWNLVARIGVHSDVMAAKVRQILSTVEDQPQVNVLPEWYY